MTAEKINELLELHIRGDIDGALDEQNLRNALLAEIAMQLATMNERLEQLVSALNRPRHFRRRNGLR